jgi:hypothetical protein
VIAVPAVPDTATQDELTLLPDTAVIPEVAIVELASAETDLLRG